MTSGQSETVDLSDVDVSAYLKLQARPLGRVRTTLLFVCGVTILVALHALAFVVLDWTTVLYGIVFGGTLLGVWLWTDGTWRLIAITITVVVSVPAREMLLPVLQGARQVDGLALGILLGLLDLREVQFWHRLRGSQRVVQWPRWRVLRPNVYVRVLLTLLLSVVLGLTGWQYARYWRQERLIVEINQFGGSVAAGVPRETAGQFSLGPKRRELYGVQLGPTGRGRREVFSGPGATRPELIAERPTDATSEYVNDLVRRIGEFKGLDTLMISDAEITNGAFAGFTGMNDLAHARISCPLVTDTGLMFLGTRPQLKWLDLTGTPVTGEMFSQSAPVAVIERLTLNGTRFNDDASKYLPLIGTLNDLDLHGTPVTDAAMPNIGKCVGLRVLDLSETKVTDAGLPHLSKLTWLLVLNLDGCDVSVNEIVKLAGSAQIEYLIVGGVDLSGDDLSLLSKFAGLRGLELRGAVLSDTALAELAAVTTLHNLDLSHTNVTDRHIETFRVFSTVGLPVREPADGSGPKGFSISWMSLKDTAITDKSLAALASLKSLTGIDLTGTKITDEGLRHLVVLPHLRTLAISDTEISDEGLRHLEECPALRHIGIDDTNVTESGFERFQTARPGVHRLPPQD